MTQEYPEGLTIAKGRFQLTRLLRGEDRDGLWLATDREANREVWVTIRRMRPMPHHFKLLTFSAYGIRPPLYVGEPDAYEAGGEYLERADLVFVDEIPKGQTIADVGRLDMREAAQLGIDLCDVVVDWAAACDGYIYKGLRPETIFVSGATGARRFTGATPRPYLMLGIETNGFECIRGGYPSPPFDPPYEELSPAPHDALFTVALLVWYAVTGIHPFDVPGSSTDSNIWAGNRHPYDGPAALGPILDRALVAERTERCSVDEFKAALAALLASDEGS